MAKITNLTVDTSGNRILVSATSTGRITEEGLTYHHKFTKLWVDNQETFNCANEPSIRASSKEITSNYNWGIYNEEISFDDILCGNPTEDLFFVWAEEHKFLEYPSFTGFSRYIPDEGVTRLFVSDGVCYYRLSLSDNTIISMQAISVIIYMRYKDDPEYTDAGFIPVMYNDAEKYADKIPRHAYLRVTNPYHLTKWFTCEVYSSTDVTEITQEIYEESRYLDVDFNYTAFSYTYSKADFYKRILKYIDIKNPDCCKADCSDVNFLLAWNGFYFADLLKMYKELIYYWNILHSSKTTAHLNCGCNG